LGEGNSEIRKKMRGEIEMWNKKNQLFKGWGKVGNFFG